MSTIFITYRRADSAGFTGHLRSRLDAHYGANAVFQDITDIPYGAEFDAAIEKSLGIAAVQLVVIGRDWLNIKDTMGNRRLDNPDDYVAREIELGLQRNIRVIPLLVDDPGLMPPPHQLPERIKGLSMKNGPTIREAMFDADVDALIKQIGPLGTRILGIRKKSLAIALGALTVGAGATAFALRPGPKPTMRDGSFNVAVAQFQEVVGKTGKSTAIARSMGSAVSTELGRALPDSPSYPVEVWDPNRTGKVEGSDDSTRIESATRLAASINADVALYSVIVPAGKTYASVRSVYVLAGDLAASKSPDLAGPYQLDDREFDRTNQASVGDVQNALVEQSKSLAALFKGLALFANGDYGKARDEFRLLEAQWTAPGADQQPALTRFLFLYLGLSEAKLRNWPEAKASYERAIALDPAFGRAQLALGEAEFQMARPSGCGDAPTLDVPAVDAALARVARAASLPDPNGMSKLATKAAMLAGRMHLCKALAWRGSSGAAAEAAAATTEYRKVVDEYRSATDASRADDVLARLAAGALADLGVFQWQVEKKLDAAERSYREATEIAASSRDPGEGAYRRNLGCVLFQAKKPDEARTALNEAIALAKKLKDREEAEKLINELTDELERGSCG